jgi:LysM repeat protein
MPTRTILSTALVSALLVAAPAHAKVGHTVVPGETLWSIAAASNLTTRTVAAFNGLSENSNVVLGSTIWIPSEAEGAAALAGSGGGAATAAAPVAATSAGAAPPPMGAYVVRLGETLSGIAARTGASVGQVAYMNGLDPAGILVAGTRLKLPTGARGSAGGPGGASSATSAPAAPAAAAVPQAAPNPTPGRTTSSEIGQIASAQGVPGSLAAAVAWQESGFNNAMVSSANARGVMQVMPGTWRWVEQNLAGRRLDPNSTSDNVHAGVMYLKQLLRDTGGDPATAAAAYYQGLGSVRERGMLPETQRYVANVMALRGRFGGP